MKTRTQKQEEAIKRNEAYQALSKDQKIASLPIDGAIRQRKKLGIYEEVVTKK